MGVWTFDRSIEKDREINCNFNRTTHIMCCSVKLTMDFPIFLDRSIKCRNWTHAKTGAVRWPLLPPGHLRPPRFLYIPFWRVLERCDDIPTDPGGTGMAVETFCFIISSLAPYTPSQIILRRQAGPSHK